MRFQVSLRTRVGWVAVSLIGLVACQSTPTVNQGSVNQDSVTQNLDSDLQDPGKPSNAANHQDLLRSIPSWETRSAARVPGIPYTSPQDRLRQVEVGRADPFAPTETIVVNVDTLDSPTTSPSGTTPSVREPVANQIAALPAIPVVGITDPLNLQPLGLSPVPVSVPQEPPVSLTPVSLDSAPVLSPTHLADQMQVKGVMEVNQKWQAIVWEPQTRISKTVQAGDVLGNGQVTVRRIEQTHNGLLRIVLEQNGIEVIHTVS